MNLYELLALVAALPVVGGGVYSWIAWGRPWMAERHKRRVQKAIDRLTKATAKLKNLETELATVKVPDVQHAQQSIGEAGNSLTTARTYLLQGDLDHAENRLDSAESYLAQGRQRVDILLLVSKAVEPQPPTPPQAPTS